MNDADNEVAVINPRRGPGKILWPQAAYDLHPADYQSACRLQQPTARAGHRGLPHREGFWQGERSPWLVRPQARLRSHDFGEAHCLGGADGDGFGLVRFFAAEATIGDLIVPMPLSVRKDFRPLSAGRTGPQTAAGLCGPCKIA